MRRALFAASLESTLVFMPFSNIDSIEAKGRLSMRVMLGIAISIPIAAIFCLVYLTALALESRREATPAHREARRIAQRDAWADRNRIAA